MGGVYFPLPEIQFYSSLYCFFLGLGSMSGEGEAEVGEGGAEVDASERFDKAAFAATVVVFALTVVWFSCIEYRSFLIRKAESVSNALRKENKLQKRNKELAARGGTGSSSLVRAVDTRITIRSRVRVMLRTSSSMVK